MREGLGPGHVQDEPFTEDLGKIKYIREARECEAAKMG